MKKLFAFLPVLALVLGIGAAFASHQPASAFANTKKAFINNQWVDITGKEIDVHYVCDESLENCTAEFNTQGQMIPNTLVRGDYRAL